jgi:hypothetical protein
MAEYELRRPPPIPEALACPICMALLAPPVSLPCGHW